MKFIILTNEDTSNEYKNNNTVLKSTDMLSKKGFENSDLLETLIPESPDLIFASPYISTLQTIYPYCINNNKNVNIDYSLFPCEHKGVERTRYNIFKNHNYLCDIINKTYLGTILSNNISKNESIFDIKNRLSPFLHKITTELKKTNTIVLIVAQQCICRLILNSFNIKPKERIKEGSIISFTVKNKNLEITTGVL